MDDNLTIALVFNTNKQMYINFEMTFVLYSENQEQWAVFRVLGHHRKCFKKSRKMAKKSGKYIFKKGIVLTIVMLFYGFV